LLATDDISALWLVICQPAGSSADFRRFASLRLWIMTQELVVTGDGAAAGMPDRCVITLALNVMADTSADALDRVGALAEQVLGVVLEQGVERSNVQTLNVSLQDWFDRESQTVTARVATYSLAVSLSGLEKAGPLLAGIAPIAGNSLQVQALRLSVADPKPLLVEARRAAVEDAMGKARELAVAAGVRLGKIMSIDDRGGARSGTGWVQTRAFAASSSMPVEAGTSEVTAQVTITFEIEN
jgi:hypothetical protein